MGISAIKYSDLKRDAIQNYVFSYDEMLSTVGDTSVYLLFAYVRICSILEKAKNGTGKNLEKLKKQKQGFTISNESEKTLAVTILRLCEQIELTTTDLKLNRLCDQLYETSTVISNFYGISKVLGSEEEDSRVLLLEAVRKIMDLNFSLLGMKTIDKI